MCSVSPRSSAGEPIGSAKAGGRIVGDGGLAMQLGELSTAVRYGLPIKLLVIKNNMLNQIAWEQMMFLGNPQFGCELQPIDFAKAAEAMGLRGFSVRKPSELDRIMDEALATTGPVLIEAEVDPAGADDAALHAAGLRPHFRRALPETPGREAIGSALEREPLSTTGAEP